MKNTVIIEKGQESGFVAYAPALKDCVSQGATKAEAINNIKEAMEAYIEALVEDGDAAVIRKRISEPSRPFREYLAEKKLKT